MGLGVCYRKDFCPGTSVCAASIGKIDAIIFVVKIIPGVFIFAEAYPYLEDFYKADSWGNVSVFEALGTSQGLMAFLMVFAAVAAFIVTTKIETRVNGKINTEFLPKTIFCPRGSCRTDWIDRICASGKTKIYNAKKLKFLRQY